MNFTITNITKDKVFAKEVNAMKDPMLYMTENKPNRWVMESYEKEFEEAENNLKEYELTKSSLYSIQEGISRGNSWIVTKIKIKFEIGQTISGTLITEDGKQKIQL